MNHLRSNNSHLFISRISGSRAGFSSGTNHLAATGVGTTRGFTCFFRHLD
jgi:hypothetical protein